MVQLVLVANPTTASDYFHNQCQLIVTPFLPLLSLSPLAVLLPMLLPRLSLPVDYFLFECLYISTVACLL